MIRRMNPSKDNPIAIANLGSKWVWHLRIDDLGLYRWYMNGEVATHLRGCTRILAESALHRFVANSLKNRASLRIADYEETTQAVCAGAER